MVLYKVNRGVQKLKSKTQRTLSTLSIGIASLGLVLALVPGLANASDPSTVVYDALPSTTPATNYPSVGFEATSTSEFGDYVHLGGTDRSLNTATVTMSDWALYSDYSSNSTYSGNSVSWTHPITLNIYSNHLGFNGAPDTLLATDTENVTIPWRPVSGGCPDHTAWLDSAGHCDHGLAFNATFDMSSLNATLPNDVIVGVAYNTADYGSAPTHQAGPYNSLNVAVPDNQAVTAGSDNNVNNVFWNTSYGPFYADGGAAGVGIFRQDTGWAPNGTVALQITTKVALPTNKDLCKKDGWKDYGSTFKNQGDCVSFVATHGKNQPSGH